MLAIGLALGASLVWGCGDFLGGLKSRVLPLLVVLLFSQGVGLLTIALVTAMSGQHAPPAHDAVLAAASAIFGTAGLAAFYRALAVGKMGVVVPISSLAAALPVVVGIASGDRPSGVQVAGIALALAGAATAAREPGSGEAGARLAAGALLAAVSAIAFGGFFIALDSASDGGAIWASLLNRTTSSLLILSAVAIARPALAQARPHLPALVAIGVFDVMANVLFAAASTKGLVSLVSVASSLYPIVTVVLARAVLKERVHRVQAGGVTAALTGVALIAVG